MSFRFITPMAACLSLGIAASGIAQSTPSAPSDRSDSARTSAFTPSKSLTLTGGFTKTNRLDAAASPRPFDGNGFAGGFGYRSSGSRWLFQSQLDGSAATYLPQTGTENADERAFSGRFDAGLTRWMITQPRRSFGVGLAANAWAEVLEHRYADPSQTTASFMSGFATLGPSATWREKLGGGEGSITASIPLVGIVHQPYADIRQEYGPITFRSAGPAQLHGFDLGLRFETSTNSRWGLVGEHRLRSFDYTGGWNVHSLTNQTSFGIVYRFGRKP